MWMLRLIITTLATVGLCSFSPSTSASSELVSKNTCFGGPFETHESWVEFLSDRNQHLDAEQMTEFLQNLNEALSKERFEKFKDSMNCQFFRYRVGDEIVGGFIVHSKDAEASETIVYNRGGNATYGSVNFFNLSQNIFDLANQGFTVIGSQYRGASTRGPESKDEFGGADVQDVLALRDLFADFKSIDPNRVGLMGWSRGSTQALLALKQGFETPAIALIAGSYDYKKGLEFRPEMERVFEVRIPDYAINKDQALADRSAVNWVDSLPRRTSFLLIHGTEDEQVRYQSSVELHDKLLQQGFESELVTSEGDGHSLRKDWPGKVDKLSAFFKAELN